MNIGLTQSLHRAYQIRAGDAAVIDDHVELTWRQVHERVARLAAGFKALGVVPGDRVGLLMLNSHRSFETFFAALWAGGVIAPLSNRLSGEELRQIIRDASPAVLVTDAKHLADARDAFSGPIIVTDALVAALSGSEADYEALLAAHQPVADAGRQDDDLACLFYTGGTTGEPKGVMLSHANIIANSFNFISHMQIDESVVHLHCGPLFHVAAAVRLFSVTQCAGTHVFLPRFAVPDVPEAIARRGVTLATFVPTMIRTLLDDPAFDPARFASLRHITYGAAPMPEPLLREVMARLPHVDFVQSYGMTETAPIATMLSAADHRDPSGQRLRSAGRPALLARVRITQADGGIAQPGERGEILVSGPMVMLGYWGKPEATAAAVRDGWMHTGDIGFLDADGYLYVVDRLKDMIITGGENVFSQEVEDAIAAHPAVHECAVIGLPDDKWGERVHAIVVPKPGQALSADEIIRHTRGTLAAFKCPKSVTIRDRPMPLSGANKILKTRLRAEALGEAG